MNSKGEYTEVNKMTFVIRARETGDVIDEFSTYKGAERQLAKYEAKDRRDGVFEERFYEIAEQNMQWVSVQEDRKRMGSIYIAECDTREGAMRSARDNWYHLSGEERKTCIVYAGLMDTITGDVHDIAWSSEEGEE